MQYNSPLPKQMTGLNLGKFLEMFIYISKIVPQDPQGNESKLEKIDQWQISHANRNTKNSSVETLVVKELVIVTFVFVLLYLYFYVVVC